LSWSGLAAFRKYSEIDKNVVERRRGITINASHIEYETVKRHYTHIDCPGHQDYIKNMILGAAQMDGVILVVAMTEGVKIQTREHVILAKELGIKYLCVYGNKMDALLEPGLDRISESDVMDLLATYDYDPDLCPFPRGSARGALQEYPESETVMGAGSVKELMNEVDEYIKQPDRVTDAPFLMSVEESLTITGRGTVLTGKVERGRIKVGEMVEIMGTSDDYYKTLCTGLEMYLKIMDYAEAGENVGILVRGVPYKKIKRGFVVAEPGTCKPWVGFEAKCVILSREEGGRRGPFGRNYKPQFFFRTTNVTGKVILGPDLYEVHPGEDVIINVVLMRSVVLEEGLRFAIREGTRTVGAGFILTLHDKSKAEHVLEWDAIHTKELENEDIA